MAEHNQHYNNPDTGQAECECCCKWALDAEEDRRRIAELEARLAALDWTPISKENPAKGDDEVGGYFEGQWEVTSVDCGGSWLEAGYTHRRPNNPPRDPSQEAQQ